VPRDIYVQDIPFDANSVGDIPDDFEPFAFADRSRDRAAVDELIRSVLDTFDLRTFDVDAEGGIFR